MAPLSHNAIGPAAWGSLLSYNTADTFTVRGSDTSDKTLWIPAGSMMRGFFTFMNYSLVIVSSVMYIKSVLFACFVQLRVQYTMIIQMIYWSINRKLICNHFDSDLLFVESFFKQKYSIFSDSSLTYVMDFLLFSGLYFSKLMNIFYLL